MLSHQKIVEEPAREHGPTLPPTSLPWLAFVLLALGALAFGVFAFSQQTFHGFILTGLRNQGYGSGGWGLYIVFDVFFVGVSFAGITVAAICRLFEIEILRPITRIAELLTITALLAGAGVVVADLGRPFEGLTRLPRFANPSSPFYGTFTLVVAGYMFSSLVYFFLAGRADAAALARTVQGPSRLFYALWASGFDDKPSERARHHRNSFFLALTILPLLVTAHSTLGFIFGLQSGRPGWFSALMAPGFVILAGVSGTGILIVLALAYRRLFRLHDKMPDSAFRWLGNFLWILALVYIYFTIADELTATYAGPVADRELAHEIVGGAFAPHFWTFAICLFLTFLIPFLMYLSGRTSVAGLVAAGLLANVAAVLKRFLIVVPSQTHGALLPIEPPKMYSPTWVEYGVILGLIGLIFVAQLVFGRFFPLVPSAHGHGKAPAKPELARRFASLVTALTAVGLIVVGLTDSFRLWSHGEIDPRIPFSPVIFASGVMLLFISAVVYEVFPERRPSDREMWREQKLALSGASLPWQPGRAPPAPTEPIRPADVHALARLIRAAEESIGKADDRRTRQIVGEVARLASALGDPLD